MSATMGRPRQATADRDLVAVGYLGSWRVVSADWLRLLAEKVAAGAAGGGGWGAHFEGEDAW